MRIGIMLRALDEKGGIGVYADNIVRELLTLDRENEYVLFFRTGERLGRFSRFPNATERLIRAPHKAFWDQLAVPAACVRERIRVLFHPKFTVPFLAPCRTVMVVHGADWFLPDQARFYSPWDVRYVRLVMPWYFRKADKVLSVSKLTTENFLSVLDLPPAKVETVYFGPARNFAPVRSEEELDRVRRRYGLPERFILTLTKLGDGNRKNFRGLVAGYARYHEKAKDPIKLVVGGKDCHRLVEQYGLPSDGYGADLVFPGWIHQSDLPAFYTLAELFLYPSNLEAFPIPITEAMACGTPIVTSRANGLEELAGDAALLVDPGSPFEIAEGIARVSGSPELKDSLSRRGLERASLFSWEKCARRTLEILEEVGE
jgi:glycosyltransferase involved in cell wall biosynthesis